jgi:hypothetical protein
MASLALLKRRITRALVRDDIDAEEMTAWVASATGRINRELRVRENLRHKVLPLVGSTFRAPADYLHHHDIRVAVNPAAGDIRVGNSRGSLVYVPPAEFSALSGSPSYAGEAPGCFTTHGSEFEITPWAVPSGTLQVSLWYFGKLAPLVADEDTNEVLEEYQDLYLSAALIYGHRFYLENDASLIKDGLVAQEIATLNDKFTDAKYGDGPLVARPARKMGGRFS